MTDIFFVPFITTVTVGSNKTQKRQYTRRINKKDVMFDHTGRYGYICMAMYESRLLLDARMSPGCDKVWRTQDQIQL